MEKIIIILAVSLSGYLQAQDTYEVRMKNGMQLWEQGKIDEATVLMEQIAIDEKDNWLPNYYIALVNTTEAFKTKDYNRLSFLLEKAGTALGKEMDKKSQNVELLVMQAMIHTAWIAYDPMTYGQILSPKVKELYKQAENIDPNNPRLVYALAEFDLGTAQFFGTETQPICLRIERSIELFDNFKPTSPFHPNWGKKQAQESLSNCK